MSISRVRLYLLLSLFVLALLLFYPTGNVVTRTYREYTGYSTYRLIQATEHEF